MPEEAKIFPEFPEITHDDEETFQECEEHDDQEHDNLEYDSQEYENQEQENPMKYSIRKALLEFRCKVEDAILSSYIFGKEKGRFSESGKEKEKLRELTIWGIPLLPSKGHEGTDAVLMKFLKAKDYKASDAFNLLQNTLKWRREMKIEGIHKENLGSDLEKVGFIGSKDKKGRTLCYNVFEIYKNRELYKERFGPEVKCEEFVRWNIQFMEKCAKTLSFKPGGGNSIIRVVDLKRAPAPAMKELPFFSKKILNLFQEYYPGIVYRNIIINVPLWLFAYHAVQLPLLTQRTPSKIIFVRPYRVTDTLLRFIAPESLPVRYGGLERKNDDDFSYHDKALQQNLRATVEKIEIPVAQAEMTVAWDVTVVGYVVSYKEEFIPDDDCSYRILIQKEKKMESSVRNYFHVREPGKIVVSIVNATYKKKKAFYRYSIKHTVTNFIK